MSLSSKGIGGWVDPLIEHKIEDWGFFWTLNTTFYLREEENKIKIKIK